VPRLLTRRPLVALAVLLAAAGPAGCAAGPTAGGTGAPASAATAAASPGPAMASPDPAVFAPVLALVVERLDTAPQVAASKWFSGQPVTDEARERVVLDAAGAAAGQAGADEEWVTAVFADQIEASKRVQQALLDAWAAGAAEAPASAPDLAAEIRPVLDRITAELVPALAAIADVRGEPGCGDALAAALAEAPAPATPEAAAALVTATAHLCG